MLIGSKTKKVPKPRKLVIVTDIVPRLCIGEHLHHDRPVRHDLLRRHQLPIANAHTQDASAQHGRILEQPECHAPWQIAINQAIISNVQSQVTLKNIGPGFLHFTQPSEFQLLTQFLNSQVVPVSFFPMLICSWHFHGQKYGTAKNASIRNRGDAYHRTEKSLPALTSWRNP